MTTLLAVLLLSGAAETPVDAIMARVAENQARAQEARRQWIYQQSVQVRLHRSGGKLAREEIRQYLVAPKPYGVEQVLQSCSGKYEYKGKMVEYKEPGRQHKDTDIDGEIVDDLAKDFASDRKSRDGGSRDLFPLTAREQAKYVFKLEGKQIYRDREVYDVTFHPKPGDNSGVWKGEALIDAAEFQPVVITTTLGQKIPLLVKTLLGTDIQQLGFKITYQKLADDIWFPASYGGEFYVRAVFFYKRKIAIAVNNSEFRKTDVASQITFEKQ